MQKINISDVEDYKSLTIGDKIIDFNLNLQMEIALPENVSIMHPYLQNAEIPLIAGEFYSKYYSDNQPRRMILGINPGRLGGGVTGIPFTDTKRLNEVCGINISSLATVEPSSIFVYRAIDVFGGAEKFYEQFYITSVCPLGFVNDKSGKEINYNYYDNALLSKAIKPFVINALWQQINFGMDTEIAFCFGTGKNYKYLSELNASERFFKRIVPLEHPRYIMQYKAKFIQFYIDKYLDAFNLH